jgi:hypothetical protein
VKLIRKFKIIAAITLFALFNDIRMEAYSSELNDFGSEVISSAALSLVLDGDLTDRVWQNTDPEKLKPFEKGVPENLAGNIQLFITGEFLCLGSFCPEPGGKVIAKATGYNPSWAKDLPDGPSLEDRILFRIYFNTTGGKRSALNLEINPWGAYRIELDGSLVPQSKILTAAAITDEGWRTESAVPLSELNMKDKQIEVDVEQIRSMRPLAPEYKWILPGNNIDKKVPETRSTQQKSLNTASRAQKYLIPSPAELSDIVFNPPPVGNNDPPLETGYVQKVPPLELSWDDPFWTVIPSLELPRNEPLPRRPKFTTQVKFVQDGKTLAMFFRCAEDERLDCDVGAKDSNVGGDDHVFIYFATSGSSVIGILANPAGAINDFKASGSNMSASSGAWNGNIEKHCLKVDDAWYIRLNIPLDEVAAGLDETGIPYEFKILTGRVRQSRPGEPREISSLPVLGNPYLTVPARYRKFVLTDKNPAAINHPSPSYRDEKLFGLAAELSKLNSDVLSRDERRHYNIPDMLENSISSRIKSLAMEEKEEWKTVSTLEDWEKYRDKRVDALKDALGDFSEKASNLNYQVSGTYDGDGYRLHNIVYQSSPGIYITASLFLPENPPEKMPGIIIIPGHHYPRTEGELQDNGMIWARCGCAVLVMEKLGMGERIENLPWNRRPYQSEYLINMQLDLIGQSRFGWMTRDVMRTVDLFYELGNIDTARIILIGAVTWGGSTPAAVAGLIDERIDAVIPVGFGRYHWESWGIRNLLAHKITPWFIYNAIAPRKFIYAHEFWWEGEEGPSYPSAWTPAWPRYKKVFGLYGADNNLRISQGTGLLRIPETAGDCYNLGPAQRKPMYPVLNEWFDIPLPSEEDQNLPIDSKLSFTKARPDYPLIKYMESQRRLPYSTLLSITPEVNAKLERRQIFEVAKETGLQLLNDARKIRAKSDFESYRQKLGDELSAVLKETDAAINPEVTPLWSKNLSEAAVEALIIKPEPEILIPLLIIKPGNRINTSSPVVIAVAEGGKDRFLKERCSDIKRLTENGITVCIPDVRGTGETAPDMYNRISGIANKELELGNTLTGLRVKDLRTVMNYIKSRGDSDSDKIALWGDSFAPVNKKEIWVDELAQWPSSPQIQHYSSPLGAHLALLTALYDKNIKAVAVRGGLIGYISILDDNFSYVPSDIVVPGILKAGDIADICAGLAPVPLFGERFVDGRNYLADNEKLDREMQIVADAYRKQGHLHDLKLRTEGSESDLITWLVNKLVK